MTSHLTRREGRVVLIECARRESDTGYVASSTVWRNGVSDTGSITRLSGKERAGLSRTALTRKALCAVVDMCSIAGKGVAGV